MQSSFRNNFLKLFSGTVIGQFLPIIVTPLLTRLYSPGEIGNFALYYSVVAIFTGVINLRIDQALVVSTYEIEVQRLFRLCSKISTLISLITFCLVFVCFLFSEITETFHFSSWWLILPFHLLFVGRVQSGTYLLNKRSQYGVMGKSKVLNGVVFALIQVSLFQFNEYGLILGSFVGMLVNSIYLGKNIVGYSKELALFSRKLSSSDFFLLKRYRNFPLFTATNGLINATSNNIPVLLLGELYDYKVTGFYSWANRIIQTPMGFILSSLQQVFYQSVADAYKNKKDLYPIVISMLKKLFLVGLIPYTIMFFFSQDIFGFVFGSEWKEAGRYTQLLTPWFFIMFLNSPITSIILILNKQKEYFLYEIVLLAFRFLALILGYYYFNDAYYSILLFGIAGAVYNLFLLRYLINLSKNG